MFNKRILFYVLMIFVPLVLLSIGSGCNVSAPNAEPATIPGPVHPNGSGPVTIYYGPNTSHGHSWAQCAPDGTVGLVYFKLSESQSGSTDRTTSTANGSLIYKTRDLDNHEQEEVVDTGTGMEISVLVYDLSGQPHIFTAVSDDTRQLIYYFQKTSAAAWEREIILDSANEGGKYIYELSAATGSADSFHLLVLKIRANPDSQEYINAYKGANLYHLSNADGSWNNQLIHHYDTIYTLDEYVKILHRQDLAVDREGFVHVVFGEQINGGNPSRLRYASNRSGQWVLETAQAPDSGSPDSAGWFPSLSLDQEDRPAISCTYVARVPTGSARYAKLHLLRRIAENEWQSTLVAENDDGYYGGDGRNYTGALSHLKFDQNNNPHIIFSDIASSHAGNNYLNLGNIRYAEYNGSSWKISTLYRQTRPESYFKATEMYGLCLLFYGPKDNKELSHFHRSLCHLLFSLGRLAVLSCCGVRSVLTAFVWPGSVSS